MNSVKFNHFTTSNEMINVIARFAQSITNKQTSIFGFGFSTSISEWNYFDFLHFRCGHRMFCCSSFGVSSKDFFIFHFSSLNNCNGFVFMASLANETTHLCMHSIWAFSFLTHIMWYFMIFEEFIEFNAIFGIDIKFS